MAKKLYLRMIAVVGWLVAHRFVLQWYKHLLGLP